MIRRARLQRQIDVEARAVLAVGHAREGFLVHFLHGLDLAAGGGNLGGDFVDRVLDRLFFAGVFKINNPS
jgi:hypothetical protein